MAVPERDAVDNCFESARSRLQGGRSGQSITADLVVDLTRSVVDALEGVARQIRDHDDTQFESRKQLSQDLADLGAIINGNMNTRED